MSDPGPRALAGQIAWFRLLADRGFPSFSLDGGVAVSAGVPSNTENGAVIAPSLLSRPADLDRLLGWLRARELPASVLLTAAADPAPLVERGLRPENAGTEMGAPLRPAPGSAASEVRGVVGGGGGASEVVDAATLRAAFGVFDGDGWFEEPGEYARVIAAAERVGYGPGTAVRHWIARSGDTVTGAASSFRFGDTVELVRCCVAAPYRRRGIGTALTRTRLAAAYADGARHVVVSPSPDGYALHSALGLTPGHTPPDRWFYLP